MVRASWLPAALLLGRRAGGQPEVWGTTCDPADCLDVRFLWTSALNGRYLPVTSGGAPCDPDASAACFAGTARRVAYVQQARSASLAAGNESLVFVDLAGSTFGGPLNGHPGFPFGAPEAILRNMTPYDVCAFGPRDFLAPSDPRAMSEMPSSYVTHACPTVLSNARLTGSWEAFGNRTVKYVVKTMRNGWKVGFLGMMTFSAQLGYGFGSDAVQVDPSNTLAQTLSGAFKYLYMAPSSLSAAIQDFQEDTTRMDAYPADVFTLSTLVSVDTLASAEELRRAHPDVNSLVLIVPGNTRDDQVRWMAEHGPFDVVMRESWPALGATPELVRNGVHNTSVLIMGCETITGLGSAHLRVRLGRGVERYRFEGTLPLNSSVPSDPAIQAEMSALYAVIRQRNSRPYGVLTNWLTGGHRGGETPPAMRQCYYTDCPAGTIIGRALLWKARSVGYRVDVSLSNLGGLRAPLRGDANKTVYMSHCLQTQSFQNIVGLYRILGKDLLGALKGLVVSGDRGFIGAGLRVAFHEPCFDFVNQTNYSTVPTTGPPGDPASLARCEAALGLGGTTLKVIDAQVQMMDWDRCTDYTTCDKFVWQQLQKGTTYTLVSTDYIQKSFIGLQPVGITMGTDAQALCDFVAGNSPVQVQPWEFYRDLGKMQYATPADGWAAGSRAPAVRIASSALDDAPTCPDGMYLPLRAPGCVPCPAGRHSATDATRDSCQPCALGFFGNQSGMDRCLACPVGYYANQAGATACSACAAGTFSDLGAIYCNSCKAGTYAASAGSESCLLCALGRYVDTVRATACADCQSGLSTQYPGSESVGACVCLGGTYAPDRGNESGCLPCPLGMTCGTGSDMRNYRARRQGNASGVDVGPYPQLLAGYWSDPDDPLSVYRCESILLCAGGDPGTCVNDGTIGVACAACAPEHYRASRGCKPCTTNDMAPMISVFIAAPVLVALLASMSAVDTENARFSVITVALTAGQLVCTVQMMGVFKEFKVMWQEPLSALMEVGALVTFNVHLLKPECFLGKDSPVFIFLIRLLCLPALGVLLAVMMTAVACRKGTCCLDLDRFQNAIGLLCVMLYVSITVAMVDPLQCVEHPNGKRSVASNLAILCWSSPEHRGLVAMSIIGFAVYPLAMLSRVAYVTWRYPSMVAEGRGSQLLTRFRFLYARFRPECYYWGFWYLLRNLLLTLVPVVAPNTSLWQIFLAGILLLTSLHFQSRLEPWRTGIANLSEVCSLACVLVFVQTASFLSESHGGTDPMVVSNLLFAILIAALGIAGLMVACGLFRMLRPGKQYNIFLSHHKEGAGCLARWFKMQILAHCHTSVFLDSDELDNLDLIVDVVRCRTGHVVLLLTKMTLTRLWCAAEIAAAVTYKVHLVPVHCCDYAPPDQAFVRSVGARWSREQLHDLEQYGITLGHVQLAYSHLMDAPAIRLRRFEPPEDQQETVQQVMTLCGCKFRIMLTPGVSSTLSGESSLANVKTKGSVSSSGSSRLTKKANARVLIIGASSDAEARTTCEVLRLQVQRKGGTSVATAYDGVEAEACRAGAEFLFVTLTRGLLNDPLFEGTCSALLAHADGLPPEVQIVTVLADTNFPFPSAEWYGPLEAEGGARAVYAAFLRRVFNVLALPFSPLGSTPIIDVQVAGLCQRLRPRKGGLGSAPNLPAVALAPSEFDESDGLDLETTMADIPGDGGVDHFDGASDMSNESI